MDNNIKVTMNKYSMTYDIAKQLVEMNKKLKKMRTKYKEEFNKKKKLLSNYTRKDFKPVENPKPRGGIRIPQVVIPGKLSYKPL